MNRRNHVGIFVPFSIIAASIGTSNLAMPSMAEAQVRSSCLGDLNSDEEIDGADLAVLLAAWGQPGATDFTDDGTTDGADLAILLAGWGPCPATAPNYRGDASPRAPEEDELTIPEYGVCGGSLIESMASNWIYGVHLFSGEFHHREIDFRIAGRGFDFVWARRYRSQARPDSGMGNRWDFSYNIYVADADNGDLALHNGNGRVIPFALQMDGTWTAPGYFRKIVDLMPGYEVQLPTGAKWVLNALDGSPTAGKIQSIDDRNGNSMTFAYDGAGRLTTITDTLGRAQTVAWVNIAGVGDRIQSVTDHTGRQWVYSYAAVGGQSGDEGVLQSARSPIVLGTPTGNDFPAGRVTQYSYNGGQTGEELSDLLVSITDPRGTTWLENVYNVTGDPDTQLGRIRQQSWGSADDRIGLSYALIQNPAQNNNFASIKVLLNDRRGAVRELFYSSANDGVMSREYTGFADPDLETTDLVNRPTGKLRASDPEFFETRVSLNADHLPVLVEMPEGDSTQYVYDALNQNPLARGNKLSQTRFPGPLGGDQTQLTESWTYLSDFGACGCGPQFATSHTDARGNTMTHSYDAAGNRTQTIDRIPTIVTDYTYNQFGQLTTITHPDNGSGHRQIDKFSYFITGPQLGYLGAETVDLGGLALNTAYLYNARGVLVAEIDPQGNRHDMTLNDLDELVSELTPDVDGLGLRYKTDHYYDAAGNSITVALENRDDSGALDAAFPTTTYSFEYGPLNELLAEEITLTPQDSMRREFLYDANRNRVEDLDGEAVNGNQPDNRIVTTYDERDLVFQTIEAPGTAIQQTTQHDYDGNRRDIRCVVGIEDATPQELIREFDGFSRAWRILDAMGNETLQVFDANGNVVDILTNGELIDGNGDAANVRLMQSASLYDALNRRTQVVNQHFDAFNGQAPVGDGLSQSLLTWTDRSQLQTEIDDNGNTTAFVYDGANRLLRTTDAKGNTVERAYNDNSQLVQLTETELSDRGFPSEVFVTSFSYDGLQRRTSITEPDTDQVFFRYDSRDNLTTHVDQRGNETHYEYDGGDRRISKSRALTDTGDGQGIVVGVIVTATEYDHSDREVARIDGNGNSTQYAYDARNRLAAVIYADGVLESFAYDTRGNIVVQTDPNGTTVTTQYDLNDRVRSRAIAPGQGVSADTTFETWEYDGVSRIVQAIDDDATVTREYDSLSKMTLDQVNGVGVVAEHDGAGNLTRATYPGGRLIEYEYNAVNRIENVNADGARIVRYRYMGPDRYERKLFVQAGPQGGVAVQYTYDSDRYLIEQRTVSQRFAAQPPVIDHRQYSFDNAGNKAMRHDLVSNVLYEYSYDSARRLVRSEFTLGQAQNSDVIDYEYDAVGNRQQVTGGPNAGLYTLDANLPAPGDFQVNQYTTTPFGSRTHDDNGNLMSENGGALVGYVFDYADRLVGVNDLNAAMPIQSNDYDPLGRRIAETVYPGGVPETTHFHFLAWRVVEERVLGVTTVTHIYGGKIDEALVSSISGVGPGHDDYGLILEESNSSVLAAVDNNGVVVGLNDYGDFGQPVVIIPSPTGLRHAFHGRRWDEATGLYNFRHRYYEPSTGRFVSRDPMGIWEDGVNVGNGLAFAGNNPWSFTDPFGLATKGTESCSGRSLKWKREDCGEKSDTSSGATDGKKLTNYLLCSAYKAIANSYEGIDDNIDDRGSSASQLETYRRMVDWFTPGGDGNLSKDKRKDVRKEFKQMRWTLRYKRFKVKCQTASQDSNCTITTNSDGSQSAWQAYVTGKSYPIVICQPQFFTWQDYSQEAAIIVHEMSHIRGTDDHYYFNWTDSGAGSSTTKTKLLDNADSYAMYAYKRYLD